MEQLRMKRDLKINDEHSWSRNRDETELQYIGGVDISFVKGSETIACSALVVLSYPDLKIVYSRCKMIEIDEPYVTGYLAFREVKFFVDLIQELRKDNMDVEPQVILVDGNGILHYRGFGVACHLGILVNIPTVGVAKNLLQMDGLARDAEYYTNVRNLKERGDQFNLIGESGKCYGIALKNTTDSTKPVYISPGHLISIQTASWVVLCCSKYRIPEPTRHADIVSREYIRGKYPATPKQRKQKRLHMKHHKEPTHTEHHEEPTHTEHQNTLI